MNRKDSTWLGEGQGIDFTATSWSCLLLGGEATPAARQATIELMARRYWKPIYHYVRSRWNRTNEDAKDLTQAFFAWMIDTDFLSKVRGDRGRFRNFVKTALERFLRGEYDSQQRLKRGGGHAHVSLEFIHALGADPATEEETPEALLNEQWRRVLIDEALARLQEFYRSQKKEVQYNVFTSFYFAPAPGPSYEELAQQFGISAVDVANYLARAKTRFRGFLEQLIADGVNGVDQLTQEFSELFGDRV